MKQNINLPLTGVKVVELSTVVAAPTTARMLCAYGAEVIKVETSYGDEHRTTGDFKQVPYEDDKNPIFTINNSNQIKEKKRFSDCLRMPIFFLPISELHLFSEQDWTTIH